MLDKINSPADVKALPDDKLPELCSELREFMVKTVSETGGHLASSLGAVELTVALHRVFDTSEDRVVFDVGHQSYAHKILTGRREAFGTLRQFGGIAGFPKPCESEHDAFIAGHASNSISAALGIARARTLAGADYNVIAVIGDGALTGGLAYEGLSDAGESGEKLIIILNDNGMSITENVGGMARYLSRERLKPSYRDFKQRYRKFMSKMPGGKGIYRFTHEVKTAVKETLLHCSLFEEMGLEYAGPVDGHDVSRVIDALEWAKTTEGPVVVHLLTTKGKGYRFAEERPDDFHGVGKFDPETGEIKDGSLSFSDVFGLELLRLAQEDERVCAVTAAMTTGTGLAGFADRYPDRFFDVGIAEGHGATMSAGLACSGMIPVFAVYSSFLQRSYDMLLHDVAISGYHVVLGVDRAGLVGADGETHHGAFDVGFLATVPGMTVFCPASFAELRSMLRRAVFGETGPVAVRYPRGGEGDYRDDAGCGAAVLREGGDITVVAYGTMINEALTAADVLAEKGISAEVIKLGCIQPLDSTAVERSLEKTHQLLVAEECAAPGCVGQRLAAHVLERGIKVGSVSLLNLGERFVPHGSVPQLRRELGIDADGITAKAAEALGNG
ncbi:MAG: 1-deoxy-D-xylulose-5-phosphate synthase [Oscillospiraceae bacterium]|nr:1-deoxy-D-xylulose-5-phosphate synthase [Oscillospiraceae bacterium]